MSRVIRTGIRWKMLVKCSSIAVCVFLDRKHSDIPNGRDFC
jgi:hypothetical protein